LQRLQQEGVEFGEEFVGRLRRAHADDADVCGSGAKCSDERGRVTVGNVQIHQDGDRALSCAPGEPVQGDGGVRKRMGEHTRRLEQEASELQLNVIVV
jgi:hypothetical protein